MLLHKHTLFSLCHFKQFGASKAINRYRASHLNPWIGYNHIQSHWHSARYHGCCCYCGAAEKQHTEISLTLTHSVPILSPSLSVFLPFSIFCSRSNQGITFSLIFLSCPPFWAYFLCLYLSVWCRFIKFIQRWWVNPLGVSSEHQSESKGRKGRIKVRLAPYICSQKIILLVWQNDRALLCQYHHVTCLEEEGSSFIITLYDSSGQRSDLSCYITVCYRIQFTVLQSFAWASQLPFFSCSKSLSSSTHAALVLVNT